jgi:hypothetical protein
MDPKSSVSCQEPAVDPVFEHQGELAVPDPAASRGQAGAVTQVEDLQEPTLRVKRAKLPPWAPLQSRNQVMPQDRALANSVYADSGQIMTQKSDAVSTTKDGGVSDGAKVLIDQETSLLIGGQTGCADQGRGNKAVGGNEQIIGNALSTGREHRSILDPRRGRPEQDGHPPPAQ